MPGGYILCEYEDVKKEFPEYQAIMNKLEVDLIEKSRVDWDPLQYGGIKPSSGQFGKSTIIPSLFADINGTQMITWEQELTAAQTGHQLLMVGSGAGHLIFEDYKVGIAGLAFLEASPKVSEIKIYISDRKLPRVNIEEAWAYEKPAVIFEDAYILDEEQTFELYGFVECPGIQKIKLIGLETNKVTDKMLTQPGAALA